MNYTESEYQYKYGMAKIHFIDRLQERYGIGLTESEYDELLTVNDYQGIFTKNTTNSLGRLTIKGVVIYVLRNSNYKLFTTALPQVVGHDIVEMIKACFPRPVRYIAFSILDDIRHELESSPIFKTEKEAAIFYFKNNKYANLLMDKYKHGKVRPIKICYTIRKVLNYNHPRAVILIGLKEK